MNALICQPRQVPQHLLTRSPHPVLPQGALYASRSSAESQSTVVYRPYESWAPNSDWSLALPSECGLWVGSTARGLCAAVLSCVRVRGVATAVRVSC